MQQWSISCNYCREIEESIFLGICHNLIFLLRERMILLLERNLGHAQDEVEHLLNLYCQFCHKLVLTDILYLGNGFHRSHNILIFITL